MEPIATHEDVTTIMRLVADIQNDVRFLRTLIQGGDDDGEEDPEADH